MGAWEDMCNKEAEKFVGGNLLSCQDQLYNLYKKVEAWTDVAHKVESNVVLRIDILKLKTCQFFTHRRRQFLPRIFAWKQNCTYLICVFCC